MRLGLVLAGMCVMLVLTSVPARARAVPCGYVGGCEPPPPPPRTDRDCADCYADPGPSALSQAITTYRRRLNAFSSYFDVGPFAGADPASEWELSGRLDRLFATGYQTYRYVARDAAYASQLTTRQRGRNEDLRNSIASARKAIEQLRIDNTLNEALTDLAERTLRELEIEAQFFQAKALALRNNHRLDQALISYVEVFGGDPNFMKAWRDNQPTYTKLHGMRLEPRVAPPRLPEAFPAPPSADDAGPLLGPMVTLRAEASVEAKLQELGKLASDLGRETANRNYFQDQLQQAQAEHAPLLAQLQTLREEKAPLSKTAELLAERQAICDTYKPVEQENRRIAATELLRETMLSFAKEKALDRAKEVVEDLVHASGISSAIPTSIEDAVMRAARAGQRIVIPHNGFENQWEAFLKVQRRTATLVQRTQGYMHEAARLMAQGTPAEVDAHIRNVFGGVQGEAAEYVRTVGYSDLDEEEAGPMKSALDRWIDSGREPETGAE